MNNINMNEKFKNAFNHIRAEDDLKDSTREFLSRKMLEYAKKRTSIQRKFPVPAVCLLFMLVSFCGGCWAYFTPVSAISIDINPSVEFSINRFDKVLSVETYHDDGIVLASALDVRFMGYMDAIERVLNDEIIKDCLARDEVLSIVVISADGEQREEMLANVETCVAGRRNVYCGAGNYEDAAKAREQGLSFGKYRAFLELQALNPDITPEDIQGWTMREIRNRIDALSGADSDGDWAGNGHYGYGYGYGYGRGNGRGRAQNE